MIEKEIQRQQFSNQIFLESHLLTELKRWMSRIWTRSG